MAVDETIETFLNEASQLDRYMKLAIELSEKSLPLDVPIGSLIVDLETQEIIGRGFNQREIKGNALNHAEIVAIKEACEFLGDWRLNNCVIFSTLEPCVMCAGALSQARIGGIVFGARDEKFGASGSIYNFAQDPRLNSNCPVVGDVLGAEIKENLKGFFSSLR